MPAWKIKDVITPLTQGGGYKPEILLRTPVSAQVYRDAEQKQAWALRSVEGLRSCFPGQPLTRTVARACDRLAKLLQAANRMPAGRPGDVQVFANLTAPTVFTGSTRPGAKVNQTDYQCDFEVTLQSYAPVTGEADTAKAAAWLRARLREFRPESQRDSDGFEHRTSVTVQDDVYVGRPPGPAGSVKAFVLGGMSYFTDRPENFGRLGPNDWS